MKNEDKIVELLVETLKKQDRHEEILGIHGKLLEQLVKGQKALVKGQEELVNGQELLVEGQKVLIDEYHKMNNPLLTRQENGR
jgi:hypothetical protein